MSTDSLSARAVQSEDGQVALFAPTVGVFIAEVLVGSELNPGDVVGRLHVLGKRHVIVVPSDVSGVVVEHVAEQAVDYATRLMLVTTENERAATARGARASAASADAIVFVAPMSGRFYRAPSPDEPAFVQEGDEISTGEIIGLLEVMKTFNRLAYGGPGLPARARIARVVSEDGADLSRGEPILELEPSSRGNPAR